MDAVSTTLDEVGPRVPGPEAGPLVPFDAPRFPLEPWKPDEVTGDARGDGADGEGARPDAA